MTVKRAEYCIDNLRFMIDDFKKYSSLAESIISVLETERDVGDIGESAENMTLYTLKYLEGAIEETRNGIFDEIEMFEMTIERDSEGEDS